MGDYLVCRAMQKSASGASQAEAGADRGLGLRGLRPWTERREQCGQETGQGSGQEGVTDVTGASDFIMKKTRGHWRGCLWDAAGERSTRRVLFHFVCLSSLPR